MNNKVLNYRRGKQIIISRLNSRYGAFKEYPLVWQHLVSRVFAETRDIWVSVDKDIVYAAVDAAIVKTLHDDRKFIALSIISSYSRDVRPFTYRKFVHWAKSCKPGSDISMLERKTSANIVTALTQDCNEVRITLDSFTKIAPALLQLLGDKVKINAQYETVIPLPSLVACVSIDYRTNGNDHRFLRQYFDRINDGKVMPRFYMSEPLNPVELM